MTVEGPNYQWKSETLYKAGDRGTGAWGVKVAAAPTIVLFEDFETLPFGITFGDNGSNAPWAQSATFSHSGTKSFKSGSIVDSQTSDAKATIPGGPMVSFWYKVSSEDGFDFFEVYLGATLVLQVSGEVDWSFAKFPVGVATDITFRYVKDSSASSGFDAVWVDELTFGNLPDSTYSPLSIDSSGALIVSGSVSGLTPLNCAKDSVGACQEGPWSVAVSGGSLDNFFQQAQKFVRVNLSASGDTTVVPAVVGKKIRVLGYNITSQTANAPVDVEFKSGAVTVLGTFKELDGLTPALFSGSLLGAAFETAVGEALVFNLSIAKVVEGHLTYIEV